MKKIIYLTAVTFLAAQGIAFAQTDATTPTSGSAAVTTPVPAAVNAPANPSSGLREVEEQIKTLRKEMDEKIKVLRQEYEAKIKAIRDGAKKKAEELRNTQKKAKEELKAKKEDAQKAIQDKRDALKQQLEALKKAKQPVAPAPQTR